MKAIDKLRSELESIGATLDDTGYDLHCDAPKGYVWRSNGMVGLSIHYATNHQQWLIAAIKSEMPGLRMGLRLADAEERKQIEWNNFEEGDETKWTAPEGSPEIIAWRPAKK